MSTTSAIILAAVAIVAVYNISEPILARCKAARAARELAERERDLEEQRWGAAATAVALRRAYASLKRQKAGGYGPWLSCCLERAARGDAVPAGVALTALRMVRDELSGRRFDLDAIDQAICDLEEREGEGE